MKKIQSALILILLFITAQSCNTTEPIIEDNIQPGRRDYLWSIDTLDAPHDSYDRIWGSSPDNIWLISGGDWDKSIAHFNGEKWAMFGVPGLIVPLAIYGFSKNHVIIGVIHGKIWKFNGNDWQEIFDLAEMGFGDVIFNNIWGESPENFYAFGANPDDDLLFNKSLILHYASSKWEKIDIDDVKGVVAKLFAGEKQELYFTTYQWNNGRSADSTFIFKKYNNETTKLYSGTLDVNSAADICLINNQVYFVLGKKIAVIENDGLKYILNLGELNFTNAIWGRTCNDIFLRMTDGLSHYNGTNLTELIKFENSASRIVSIALFEAEIFMLVHDNYSRLDLIYHGQLEE